MGCTSTRQPEQNISHISQDIKYLLPDIEKAIRLAQLCIYAADSPIQFTPIKQIGNTLCKTERVLPSGSSKIRGAYNMLFRQMDKKRIHGERDLKVVLASSDNVALACIESMRLLNRQFKEPESQPQSLLLVDYTPTDTGQSVEVDDQIIQSKVRTVGLLGEIVIFSQSIPYEELNYAGVKVIQMDKPIEELIQDAINFAKDNDFDYFDNFNDLDIMGGYSTIGFEIERQLKFHKTQVNNIFIPYKGDALVAGIAVQLKYISKLDINIIGVKLEGYNIVSCLSTLIADSLVDEFISVTAEEVEWAQCQLSVSQEITDFWGAVGYAGSLKNKKPNSLVVLTGGNIQIDELQQLVEKYKSR